MKESHTRTHTHTNAHFLPFLPFICRMNNNTSTSKSLTAGAQKTTTTKKKTRHWYDPCATWAVSQDTHCFWSYTALKMNKGDPFFSHPACLLKVFDFWMIGLIIMPFHNQSSNQSINVINVGQSKWAATQLRTFFAAEKKKNSPTLLRSGIQFFY